MLNILSACVGKRLSGPDTGVARPHRSALLAHAGGSQEARLCRSDRGQWRSGFQSRPWTTSVKTLLRRSMPRACATGSIRPRPPPTRPGQANGNGDTIVLSAADRWGNMVSWVNSNFSGFGSGVTVPGYGFLLHNRGGLFTLDPKSPNAIAPHKRPFNTLAAGFLLESGRADGQRMSAAVDGRRHAGAGPCADGGQSGRSGRRICRRRPTWRGSIMPRSATGCIWNPNSQNVSVRNSRPWAMMLSRPMASRWAAIRPFCSHPIRKSLPPNPARTSQAPVNGVYRAGTDHRKDGLAAGW